MTNQFFSLREFLIAELSFTTIKSNGMHTFLAPADLWQNNHNRSDQPLVLRVNTAPGGKDLEVTVLMANIPIVKLSADDAHRLEPQMIEQLITRGKVILELLHQERRSVTALVKALLPDVRVIEVNA